MTPCAPTMLSWRRKLPSFTSPTKSPSWSRRRSYFFPFPAIAPKKPSCFSVRSCPRTVPSFRIFLAFSGESELCAEGSRSFARRSPSALGLPGWSRCVLIEKGFQNASVVPRPYPPVCSPGMLVPLYTFQVRVGFLCGGACSSTPRRENRTSAFLPKRLAALALLLRDLTLHGLETRMLLTLLGRIAGL